MARIGFLGIPAGEITWAGLLEGSAGVIGALLVAVIAFRLQVRETRRADLKRAVETLLDDIVHAQNVLMRASGTEEKVDLGTKADISFQVVRATTQVATRCRWRDRALRDGSTELDALLSEAIWKADESSLHSPSASSSRALGWPIHARCGGGRSR